MERHVIAWKRKEMNKAYNIDTSYKKFNRRCECERGEEQEREWKRGKEREINGVEILGRGRCMRKRRDILGGRGRKREGGEWGREIARLSVRGWGEIKGM
jgi:hypothetical protein